LNKSIQKVLIDIGHPSYYLFFRNVALLLRKEGISVLFTLKDKDVTLKLAENDDFESICLDKHYSSIYGKIKGSINYTLKLIRIAKKYQPDLMVSLASISNAIAAFTIRIPSITFEDTENLEQILLYKPFTNLILTHKSFRKNLGKKHFYYNGFPQLAYLHPNCFQIKPFEDVNRINQNKKVIVVRFVSWSASHDIGHSGISVNNKLLLIESLSKYAKVYISSEKSLPPELELYRFNYPANSIHQLMASSDLLFGESATMASEAAMLGVPSIYINNLSMGYIDDEKEHQLLFQIENIDDIIGKFDEILNIEDRQNVFLERKNKLLKNKIDPTAFLYWFIENYPESASIMKSNPDYQYNFR
jgi:uncharacterized protein